MIKKGNAKSLPAILMSEDCKELILSLSTSPRAHNSGLGVRLIEASLVVNTAKFGSMNCYARIVYGEQNWKSPLSSRSGMNPKWNSYHTFEQSESENIEVTVYDKGLIKDTLVGSCKLNLTEIKAGHQTEWWSLVNMATPVGTVLITFDLPNDESVLITTHSSHNSTDFREEYFRQLAELEAEKDALNAKWAHFNKSSKLHTESVQKLRKELAEENNKLREKEANLKSLFEQAKNESAKLKKAKAELKRCRESLKRREQSLQMEEVEIQNEKQRIQKEREQQQQFRAQLSHDFAKLKQEKHKLTASKRDLEKTSKELGANTKQLLKEKVFLSKLSLQAKTQDNSEWELRNIKSALRDNKELLNAKSEENLKQEDSSNLRLSPFKFWSPEAPKHQEFLDHKKSFTQGKPIF